jgi:tRNA-2-methylthio-N6-dimethylallyladenosine synthase
MDDDLVTAHAELPVLMPYVHLPVQSGSNRVLAAMNRKHTRRDYLNVVARLRASRADLAFTSDFIVGFPGESERDFRDTLALIDEVGFAGAFSFMYSARPGTPAAERTDQIPQEERPNGCKGCKPPSRASARFQRWLCGRTIDVLLESPADYLGSSSAAPFTGSPVMASANLIGSVKRVTVTDVGSNSLFGTFAGETRAPALPQQELETPCAPRIPSSRLPPPRETATTQTVLALRQQARLGPFWAIRTEPRADRTTPRRSGGTAWQST